MADDEIADLRARLQYLERELGLSYEAEKFERRMNSLFPDDCTITSDGSSGYMSAKGSVDTYEVQNIIRKVDKIDGMGWEIKETDGDQVVMKVAEGLVNPQ